MNHTHNGTARSILAGLAVGIQPPMSHNYRSCLRNLMNKGLIEPTRKRGVWRLTEAGAADVQARSDRLSARVSPRT